MHTLKFAHLDSAMRIIQDPDPVLATVETAQSRERERLAQEARPDSRATMEDLEKPQREIRSAPSEVPQEEQDEPYDREDQDDPLEGPER